MSHAFSPRPQKKLMTETDYCDFPLGRYQREKDSDLGLGSASQG